MEVRLAEKVRLTAKHRARGALLLHAHLRRGAIPEPRLAESALALREVDDAHIKFLGEQKRRAGAAGEIVRVRTNEHDALAPDIGNERERGSRQDKQRNDFKQNCGLRHCLSS